MTTIQIQYLLAYLGKEYNRKSLDPVYLDGIPGKRTEAAVRDFQSLFGLPVTGQADDDTQKALKHSVSYGLEIPEAPVETTPEKTGTFWDEIDHWTHQEFACQCANYNGPYCDGFPVEPDETLVRLADRVRKHFGRPAHRSSGIRCPQHNADSGGVANSKHMSGKALDFFVEGVSGQQLLNYVQDQPEVNYAYIISGQYVHMDVR